MSVAVITLCIILSGAGSAISADKYSGFLEGYPKFEPDADRKGALVYRKAGVDLKNYTKVMIDPIEIWIAPNSKYKGIKPDQLKVLADAFRQSIIEELEPAYPVVSKPGPDVLGVRIAITNVYMTKKKRGLLGFTPVGLAASTVAKAVGDNTSLQEAVIETELLNSVTNERLGVLIDQQSKTVKSDPLSAFKPVKKGKTSWDEIMNTLEFYAKRFRARLDKDHGM
jgi:hypothetical protein